MQRLFVLAGIAFVGLLLFVRSARGPEPTPRTVLSVFAASSLTEAFQDIEQAFEAGHPTVDVHLSFAGSQVLRLQIEQGARADVFASANEAHLGDLLAAGLVSAPSGFALNQLVVIVPHDNPAGIERFEELDRAERIVLGSPFVPVGIYAREALDRARVAVGEGFVASVLDRVVSEETNARLVLAKIELGEADAAVVYRTDAEGSDLLQLIPLPESVRVAARYSIGAVTRPTASPAAERFVAFVRSPEAQSILEARGFEVRP